MYVGIDTLPPEDQEEANLCLEGDEANLFSLTRQLIQAAPEREWDMVVTDYMSGHHPKEFLRLVLTELGCIHPDTPFVDVVNSAVLFERKDDALRQEAAIGELFRRSNLEGKNVLLLTEFVGGGSHIARLSRLAMRYSDSTSPAAIDLATMGSLHPEHWSGWSTIVPGERYVGAYGDGQDLDQQPYLSRSIPLLNSTGFKTGNFLESGIAEPQPLGLDVYRSYEQGIGRAIIGIADKFLDQV